MLYYMCGKIRQDDQVCESLSDLQLSKSHDLGIRAKNDSTSLSWFFFLQKVANKGYKPSYKALVAVAVFIPLLISVIYLYTVAHIISLRLFCS